MKQAAVLEELPEHLVRLYAMALDCHSALIHSNGQASLFKTVCQLGVQSAVFDTLWIGLMDPSTVNIR